MNGFKVFADKAMMLIIMGVHEIGRISWVAFIGIGCIGGALYMFGNEFGAFKIWRRAAIGYLAIQIANLLI